MNVQRNERIGYSEKINDSAFAQYLNNSGRWSMYFSLLLAVIAVVGFFIYGETSSDMDNPQAMFIGLGIGIMFVAIAIFQIVSRKRSTTWDGIVVDKIFEKKRRKKYVAGSAEEREYYWEDYELFTVFIRSDNGKIHTITAENDDTLYNYYQIGDKVRHHAGLNSFEKYDKSQDTIIFCNACASLNDIEDDYCHRCKCPLLK